MTTAFQEAIREAFVLAPANVLIYDTLEIRQPTVQGAIFLVRSRRSITAMDENDVEHIFEPSGFQWTFPPTTEEGAHSLNLAIDNVGRRINTFIENAVSQRVPVEVVYRPYLSTDLTRPQMIPPLVLFLRDIHVTEEQVTGRATFMDMVNQSFPSELYTRSRFPSLG